MSDFSIQFTDDLAVDPATGETQSKTSSPAGMSATSPATTVATPQPISKPAAPTSGSSGDFEGAAVTTFVLKLSGSCLVDTYGETVSIDDLIRVCGEFRVTGVSFEVTKDGSIQRVQKASPVSELTLVPFDHTNPNDNGIVRARP